VIKARRFWAVRSTAALLISPAPRVGVIETTEWPPAVGRVAKPHLATAVAPARFTLLSCQVAKAKRIRSAAAKYSNQGRLTFDLHPSTRYGLLTCPNDLH
jgi:hypothetical protein